MVSRCVNFVLLAIHEKLECCYSHLTTKKANYYRPQRSYGKVIFSQASVSHSVHRGGCLADTLPRQTTHRQTPPADIHPDRHPQADTHRRHPPRQTHTPGRHPPPADTPLPADGYCCGRYASYWNAFLFIVVVTA